MQFKSSLRVPRGYKDMRSIFNRTFIAYWLLGLPIGYILGMTDWIAEPMGAHGFWIALHYWLVFSSNYAGGAFIGCTNKVMKYSWVRLANRFLKTSELKQKSTDNQSSFLFHVHTFSVSKIVINNACSARWCNCLIITFLSNEPCKLRLTILSEAIVTEGNRLPISERQAHLSVKPLPRKNSTPSFVY